MASIDSIVSYFLTRFLIVLFGTLILVVFVLPRFRFLYNAVFAYIVNRCAMGINKRLRNEKIELFQQMNDQLLSSGKSSLLVLEIGIGSGANFQFYPKGTEVIGVDPNSKFEPYLKENIGKYKDNVNLKEFVIAGGEDMISLPEEHVDAVVCTLVLCSVKDVLLTLYNIKRVLKMGGKFYYLEHIKGQDDTYNLTVQKLLRPLWWGMCGCDLVRETDTMIKTSGFTDVKQRIFDAAYISKWLWMVRRTVMGVATK